MTMKLGLYHTPKKCHSIKLRLHVFFNTGLHTLCRRHDLNFSVFVEYSRKNIIIFCSSEEVLDIYRFLS